MNSKNSGHVDIGALFEFATLQIELDMTSRSHLEECAVCMDRLAWMKSTKVMGSERKPDEPDA
jgi:hypothetical protein